MVPSFKQGRPIGIRRTGLALSSPGGWTLLDQPCASCHLISALSTEERSGGHAHKLLASNELLCSMYSIFLYLYWVSYVISKWICCIKLFISLTDQVMLGEGILFFIMSSCSVVVASQWVIRWCKVSLNCLHSLQVRSISEFNFDWKYTRLFLVYVPIFGIYFALLLAGKVKEYLLKLRSPVTRWRLQLGTY